MMDGLTYKVPVSSLLKAGYSLQELSPLTQVIFAELHSSPVRLNLVTLY